MHTLSNLRRRCQQICHRSNIDKPFSNICLRSNKIFANINNNIRWNTSAADNSVLRNVNRIILIRHGESLGNIDERAYQTTADWRIPLTKKGREQASLAGKKVASHLSLQSDDNSSKEVDLTKGRVFFYVSPYLRTRQTLREILREVPKDCIIGIREDPRIAEQQFGNFQSTAIQDNKAKRTDFGRFFYRFPSGESGFDVYNRISGFIGTMQRDASDDQSSKGEGMTICIVTHGLALRLFLMRWFQYTVHEFERSYNPKNGRVVILEPAKGGGFELTTADRLAMGFPTYKDQERFKLMNDYELLDRSQW